MIEIKSSRNIFCLIIFMCFCLSCEKKDRIKSKINSKIEEYQPSNKGYDLCNYYCGSCHQDAQVENLKDKMNLYYLQQLINKNKFIFDRNIKEHLSLTKDKISYEQINIIKKYIEGINYKILPGEPIY